MPTQFQLAVYELTRQIPKGKVSTYKAIANELGTAAYRAVGSALKHNPDIPQTPCHRVINANGDIGAYAGVGGTERKRALLESEGVVVTKNKVDLKLFEHVFN